MFRGIGKYFHPRDYRRAAIFACGQGGFPHFLSGRHGLHRHRFHDDCTLRRCKAKARAVGIGKIRHDRGDIAQRDDQRGLRARVA